MKSHFTIFISFLMFSCISNVEITLPEQERELTLNCILNPDSDTVMAWISYSKPLLDTVILEQVNDVIVTLIEEDKTIGQFIKSDSTAFILPFKVNPGNTYKIEATIENNDIWAKTCIPKQIYAQIESIDGLGDNKYYNVFFNDKPDEENYYWIGTKGYTWYDGKPFYDISTALFSNYILADDFNRLPEQFQEFSYSYEYYIRISDSALPSKTVELQFYPSGIYITNGPQKVFILSVDNHLDKYMKSSLLLEEIDSYAEDVPIVYSPFPIYSNINGGTGIFGSYTSVSKVFTKN